MLSVENIEAKVSPNGNNWYKFSLRVSVPGGWVLVHGWRYMPLNGSLTPPSVKSKNFWFQIAQIDKNSAAELKEHLRNYLIPRLEGEAKKEVEGDSTAETVRRELI